MFCLEEEILNNTILDIAVSSGYELSSTPRNALAHGDNSGGSSVGGVN